MLNSKIWDAYDKNCWFYERAKLSYFTFKNGIQIAQSKRHVTLTRGVSLCVRDQSDMTERKKTERKGGRYCAAGAPNDQSCNTAQNAYCSRDIYLQF